MWSRLTIGLALMWLASSAFAAEYDLCARGIGDRLTRTVRVRLSVDGPDLGGLRDEVAKQLINRLVFQGHALEVFVEPFDEALCSASLGKKYNIAIAITQAELDQLDAEIKRGVRGEETPTLSAMGDGATLSANEIKHLQKLESAFVVRVYYATNRNDTGNADPTERFGSDRGQAVSFGAVHVSIPEDHRMGELETPSILRLEFRADPDRHIVLMELQPLGHDAWQEELRARASKLGQPGVLLFIHGYNVTFADAAIRTAQLAYDLGFSGAAVFFSWPSRGEPIPYPADEQAAEWAATDMKEVLTQLANLAPRERVYVIAHSMGNRILTQGFARLINDTRNQVNVRQFKEIVLTAPDIDAEVFRSDIAPAILGIGPRITLYASSNDTALVASSKFHGGYRRLGEGGDAITVLPGMDSIDASNVKTDYLGHSYFGDSSTVMSDLFYLIRKGLKPSERFGLVPVPSDAGQYWRFKP